MGIPWMSEWDRIASARGSRPRIKSNGERGQPCLLPLVAGKVCDKKWRPFGPRMKG